MEKVGLKCHLRVIKYVIGIKNLSFVFQIFVYLFYSFFLIKEICHLYLPFWPPRKSLLFFPSLQLTPFVFYAYWTADVNATDIRL